MNIRKSNQCKRNKLVVFEYFTVYFSFSMTFRRLMGLISKQLRKDTSFNRCESIFKEISDEFCECFQTTLTLTDCTSPIRVRAKFS